MASMLMGGVAPSGITPESIRDILEKPFTKPKTTTLNIQGIEKRYVYDSFAELMDELGVDLDLMISLLTDYFVTSLEYGYTPTDRTLTSYAQARARIIDMGEAYVAVASKVIRYVRSPNKLAIQRYAIATRGVPETLAIAASFTPGFSENRDKKYTAFTGSMNTQMARWSSSALGRMRAAARASRWAPRIGLTPTVTPFRTRSALREGWANHSLGLARPARREVTPRTEAQIAKQAEREQRRLMAMQLPEYFGNVLNAPVDEATQRQARAYLAAQRAAAQQRLIAQADALRATMTQPP